MSDPSLTSPPLPTSTLMYDGCKRAFDICASLFLLLLFSPIIVGVAIWIRCTSKGSIFYKQARVGRYNRLFLVFKFRTMLSDADRCGPLITAADDDRITPVGKFLRKNKLDELPQLWNVFRGEMSLVGPRPQVLRFVEKFPDAQRDIVLAVRPGITGPTQLQFRCEEQMLEGRQDRERYYIENLLPIKCQMDVDYVCQRSHRLDMRVLVETGAIVSMSLIRRALGRNHMPTEAVVMNTLPPVYGRHDNVHNDQEEIAPVQSVS